MLPNFRQMYYGLFSAGTTIHRMNERIDEGAIVAQDETLIATREGLNSVILRTKRKGAQLVLKVLSQLKDGTYNEIENDERTYYSFPTRSDVAEFRRRGYELHWTCNVMYLDLVRSCIRIVLISNGRMLLFEYRSYSVDSQQLDEKQ